MIELADVEEKCEICNKIITNEMKCQQNVVYCNAEHTLDENHMLNDLMYDGVCCSWECYRKLIGLDRERIKAINEIQKYLKSDEFHEWFKDESEDIPFKIAEKLEKLK